MLYQNKVNIEATGWLATRLLRRVEKEWENDRRDEIGGIGIKMSFAAGV